MGIQRVERVGRGSVTAGTRGVRVLGWHVI